MRATPQSSPKVEKVDDCYHFTSVQLLNYSDLNVEFQYKTMEKCTISKVFFEKEIK